MTTLAAALNGVSAGDLDTELRTLADLAAHGVAARLTPAIKRAGGELLGVRYTNTVTERGESGVHTEVQFAVRIRIAGVDAYDVSEPSITDVIFGAGTDGHAERDVHEIRVGCLLVNNDIYPIGDHAECARIERAIEQIRGANA